MGWGEGANRGQLGPVRRRRKLKKGGVEPEKETQLQHLAPQCRGRVESEKSVLVLEAVAFVVVSVSPAAPIGAGAGERVCV